MLILAALDIVEVFLDSNKEDPFCQVFYQDLTAEELKILKEHIQTVPVNLINFDRPGITPVEINQDRTTSGCIVAVVRNMTNLRFQVGSALTPLAKWILLDANESPFSVNELDPAISMDLALNPPTVSLTLLSPELVGLTVPCQKPGQLANIWTDPVGFTMDLKFNNPYDLCPGIREQVSGQVFKALAFGYNPYIINTGTGFVGVDARVMEVVGNKFNFQLDIHKSKSWDLRVNGTRTGTIGEVTRKTIKITGST